MTQTATGTHLTREAVLAAARHHFDSGRFEAELARRISYRSESQSSDTVPLRAYLKNELLPTLEALAFTVRIDENPMPPHRAPFMIASRIEDVPLPTVLMYGHGDVVSGMEGRWSPGTEPWQLDIVGDRWYGRGTADNKGQHSINLAALGVLIAERKALGFNIKMLFEMGEEIGSPGLAEYCRNNRDELASDVFIASDGPRMAAQTPTVFLGSRGIVYFELSVNLRDKAYHSGNWGGLLRNPATTLAAAIQCLVDGNGVIAVEGLRPKSLTSAVRRVLGDVHVGGDPGDPVIDCGWGEPGLTPEERVYGWNSLEVLAMQSGNVGKPVNAIPGTAIAQCQLRFVVGTEWRTLESQVRNHLDMHGFPMVAVKAARGSPATRLDPESAWVRFAVRSIEQTTGKKAAILPNLGGTLPNEVFSDILGLPTVWIPHSYPSCAQHAPDEHLLGSVAREGLQMMAGLFWDLGNPAEAAARDEGVAA